MKKKVKNQILVSKSKDDAILIEEYLLNVLAYSKEFKELISNISFDWVNKWHETVFKAFYDSNNSLLGKIIEQVEKLMDLCIKQKNDINYLYRLVDKTKVLN